MQMIWLVAWLLFNVWLFADRMNLSDFIVISFQSLKLLFEAIKQTIQSREQCSTIRSKYSRSGNIDISLWSFLFSFILWFISIKPMLFISTMMHTHTQTYQSLIDCVTQNIVSIDERKKKRELNVIRNNCVILHGVISEMVPWQLTL